MPLAMLLALSVVACLSADDQTNFSEMNGSSGATAVGGTAGTSAGGSEPTAGSSAGGSTTAGTAGVGGSGGSDLGGSAGDAGSGGSASAGTAGDGAGGSSGVGGTSAGAAGSAGANQGGSAGSNGCHPTAMERCDGIDNNCQDGVQDEECPSNCVGVARGNRGYMFCSDPDGDDDYADAAAVCGAENLSVVSIETLDENSWLVETALDNGLQGLVWIGASDREDEGEWFWATGVQFWSGDENGSPVGEQQPNWADGRPNAMEPGEDCAILQLEDGSWNDVLCGGMMGNYDFICESVAIVALP